MGHGVSARNFQAISFIDKPLYAYEKVSRFVLPYPVYSQ